jgi:hypothetical protein
VKPQIGGKPTDTRRAHPRRKRFIDSIEIEGQKRRDTDPSDHPIDLSVRYTGAKEALPTPTADIFEVGSGTRLGLNTKHRVAETNLRWILTRLAKRRSGVPLSIDELSHIEVSIDVDNANLSASSDISEKMAVRGLMPSPKNDRNYRPFEELRDDLAQRRLISRKLPREHDITEIHYPPP